MNFYSILSTSKQIVPLSPDSGMGSLITELILFVNTVCLSTKKINDNVRNRIRHRDGAHRHIRRSRHIHNCILLR